MNHHSFYQSRSNDLAAQVRSLRARSRAFVMGEVASFLAVVACLAAVTVTDDRTLTYLEVGLAAVSLAIYISVRQRDTSNDARIRSMESLKQVYDNELRALSGDYSGFDDGRCYVDSHHAYTFDLDIFGRDGLYQRMCRTVTTGGSDALARRLGSLDGRIGPTPDAGVADGYDAAYRQRIEALAADEPLRAAFIAHGVRQKIDTEAIRQTLNDAAAVTVSRLFDSTVAKVLALAVLAGFLASICMAATGRADGMLPIVWGTAQFFAVYLLCMRPLRHISEAVNRLHGQLRRFVEVARLMDDAGADVFARLTALMDGLDRRGNVMGLIIVDTLALYDFFLVRKFIRWTRIDAREMHRWIDRVVAMDQDVTVATFLANHPDSCWPEVTDAEGVAYEVQGLYHPFLGARAVRNDFTIDDRHFYIITGANMAGKSTFLRAVGVNYVLAMTGMPVFARSLRVSRFALFSSMRTTDDLSHGISYFNAELLRLGHLIDHCRQNAHTLIILDEILKGTNSLDKLNGSRLFLTSIGRLPVSGIVATHDLELSKMESERVHNFCFEIELGEEVTYSYQISPGVARNQNATFLLRRMLAGG